MAKSYSVDVHHVTRVEGHGNILVNVANGTVEECTWKVVEAPRFFESFIRGRHYSEVRRLVSRICGICAIAHSLASVKATENALGIQISEQTDTLRRICKHAEVLDSNFLHVLFLAAPDFLGLPSVFPLLEQNKELFTLAVEMKKTVGDFADLIGGRAVHPLRIIPGGFSKVPTAHELATMIERLKNLVGQFDAVKDILKSVAHTIPTFERETEYIALKDDVEYGQYDGLIASYMPGGKVETYSVADYKNITNEFVTPHSTAKYTKHNLDSYGVGALARIHVSWDQLHPKAREVADELGFSIPCYKPYFITIAQFIECYHSAYTGIEYMQKLIDTGIRNEKPAEPTKFAQGAGATEAPRGILFHDYTYNEKGICIDGNAIIPTNQNHNNIQHDFDKLVPELINEGVDEKTMELRLEMLVRAYDPCISCSTHYMDIQFKK